MTDYTELVKALRNHASKESDCRSCKYYYYNIVKYDTCSSSLCAAAASAIEELQAQLPKRGEWVYKPKDAIEMMFTLPKCSVCGNESSDANNYCPNCGAKMREVQE